ncbi:hypothetical protein FJY63_14640, partial [Candidatus Sumerlaeota bacterium]|nr:hypothetical protein [Candidatus Sumerlaeota bacterium]
PLIFSSSHATELTEPLAAAEALIEKAGNATNDEIRLAHLGQLRDLPGLSKSLTSDTLKMITVVDRWLHDRQLTYFGREIGRKREYDFQIAANSPLYPLTHIYRGRMLTWYALESGNVWKDPETRDDFLGSARRSFQKAAKAFPKNKIVHMYLGRAIPPTKLYAACRAAPAWANSQREALERLADIVEWWIDNRMRENGEFGGGWGDDCEMWRWWVPVLIAFDDPKITQTQARFSQAILSASHMAHGYTTIMSDVEHTAEDSADAITPMMHLEPDNDQWSKRALRLADLMETLWTGKNERGFLQFKSTYFTADKVSTRTQQACDTVYHPRAIQPALIYWQRTRDERLTRLVASWMDTWVDAAARAERGKPAGVLPTAIHWPDGGIGGVGKNWWDPENHSERTLYLFPSAMSMMMHTLLLTYQMTGQEKYLAPIRSMAAIRLKYLKAPPRNPPQPGSEAWCAARMGSLTSVVAKYRLLTGSGEFDGLLGREMHPYVQLRLQGKRQPLVKALNDNAAALRINFPGYTSEVRYTDRVLRFPTLFGEKGILGKSVKAIREPDTDLL